MMQHAVGCFVGVKNSDSKIGIQLHYISQTFREVSHQIIMLFIDIYLHRFLNTYLPV